MTMQAEASPAGLPPPGSAAEGARTRRRSPPWHPAFVHLPLACWVLATLFDVGALAGLAPLAAAWDLPEPGAVASLLLWLGLASSVPAVGIGLVDYSRLPAAARDSAEMLRHVAWMGGAASLFLIAALLRVAENTLPEAFVTAVEVVGTVCLVAGGHSAAVVVFERLPEATADTRSSDRVRST